jgi:hypothetical protein
MAQVVGEKDVVLFNSTQLPRMDNNFHCYSDIDPNNIDFERYPELRHVRKLKVRLAPGEVLFIPVGWWHHVTALSVSMTLTFTNFKWPNDFTRNYLTYHEI